jgi:hypothetical protein
LLVGTDPRPRGMPAIAFPASSHRLSTARRAVVAVCGLCRALDAADQRRGALPQLLPDGQAAWWGLVNCRTLIQ